MRVDVRELMACGWSKDQVRRALNMGVPVKHALTWARARRDTDELLSQYAAVRQARADLPAAVLMLAALLGHLGHIFVKATRPAQAAFRHAVLTRWLRSLATSAWAALRLGRQVAEEEVTRNLRDWDVAKGCKEKAKRVAKSVLIGGGTGWAPSLPRSTPFVLLGLLCWILDVLTGSGKLWRRLLRHCYLNKQCERLDAWLSYSFGKRGGAAVRMLTHQVMGPVLTGLLGCYLFGPFGAFGVVLSRAGRAVFNCVPLLRLAVALALAGVFVFVRWLCPWVGRYICLAVRGLRSRRERRRLARAARRQRRTEAATPAHDNNVLVGV